MTATAQRKSLVRDNWQAQVLGVLAGWLMRLWCLTLRFEIIDRAQLGEPSKYPGPVIYALWHNRIFVMPYAWKRKFGKTRQSVVLTSASHDGSMLARMMKVFGIGAVRGSSSRRGAAALVALRKSLRAGVDACVTPDGPKGPRYQFQPGIVKLAEATGVEIVPIHVEFASAWRTKTWDQFCLPVPGSRVRVIFDCALEIPSGLSESEFEQFRDRLETMMREEAEKPYA